MSRYDELRERYPGVTPEFFELIEERTRAERELADLRVKMAELVGYHDADGAIPVAKIQALLSDGGAP